MIKPSVGRMVHFWDRGTRFNLDRPRAATIAFVHSDHCVNLSVIDHSGAQYYRENVLLLQGGAGWTDGSYCEWPPHQANQRTDAKSETEFEDDGFDPSKVAERIASEQLSAEVDHGKSAATALCRHVVAMGAGGVRIPVTLDGIDYLVSVETKKPDSDSVATSDQSNAIAAAEREACAQVCMNAREESNNHLFRSAMVIAAGEILARGKRAQGSKS